jgi:hypothetical protein
MVNLGTTWIQHPIPTEYDEIPFEYGNRYVKRWKNIKCTKPRPNALRRGPDGSVEVMLDKGHTMLVDFTPLAMDLVTKYLWRVDGVRARDGYATTKYGLFHKMLTRFERTDHINRNRLDNRMFNLRPTTCLENMHNMSRRKDSKTPGVCFDSKNIGWVVYRSSIWFQNKRHRLSYSVNKYGDDGAFRRACYARHAFCKLFGSENDCVPLPKPFDDAMYTAVSIDVMESVYNNNKRSKNHVSASFQHFQQASSSNDADDTDQDEMDVDQKMDAIKKPTYGLTIRPGCCLDMLVELGQLGQL